MPLESHKQWLRRMTLPSIALTFGVVLWSSILGVVIYRMLGVSIVSVNGRPATLADEILINGVGGAITAVFLNCFLLIFLFIGRIPFKWWLLVILVIIAGTPLALYSGWRIADYLWTLNQGGIAWEGFAPQVLGLALAWVLHIPLSIWLSKYKFVIVKVDDSHKSPCPRCGYELFGSNGTCPECDWQIPISLLKSEATKSPAAVDHRRRKLIIDKG